VIEVDHLRDIGEAVEGRPDGLMIAARTAGKADEDRLLPEGSSLDLQLRAEDIEEQTHVIDGDEHGRASTVDLVFDCA
jgi:hypothetical protein